MIMVQVAAESDHARHIKKVGNLDRIRSLCREIYLKGISSDVGWFVHQGDRLVGEAYPFAKDRGLRSGFCVRAKFTESVCGWSWEVDEASLQTWPDPCLTPPKVLDRSAYWRNEIAPWFPAVRGSSAISSLHGAHVMSSTKAGRAVDALNAGTRSLHTLEWGDCPHTYRVDLKATWPMLGHVRCVRWDELRGRWIGMDSRGEQVVVVPEGMSNDSRFRHAETRLPLSAKIRPKVVEKIMQPVINTSSHGG